MRFLADMGISQSTVKWLQKSGHEVIHLSDEGLHKLSDEKIFRKALNEQRIILTFDLDFSDISAASGKHLPSIIIFRLQDERPNNVNRILDSVLKTSTKDLEQGAIISANKKRFRIRHLPI